MLNPHIGYGLGLRPVYYQTILAEKPAVDWFEIMSEDYFDCGGRPWHYLSNIRENYPVVMHGVSLSIGSQDPLNQAYLQALKRLMRRIEPKWVSDHLCWTGVDGVHLHDLMPLPYTEEALQHVVNRVKQVQDFLGRQILLENVSSYITYKASSMTEWEFLVEVAKRSDCLILLDINNIYVSAINHQFSPQDYLNSIPVERVQQFHVAGHTDCGTHLIDTHDESVPDPVWSLYRDAIKRFGAVSTLLERDDNWPPFSELLAELFYAKRVAQTALKKCV